MKALYMLFCGLIAYLIAVSAESNSAILIGLAGCVAGLLIAVVFQRFGIQLFQGWSQKRSDPMWWVVTVILCGLSIGLSVLFGIWVVGATLAVAILIVRLAI